MANNNTTKVKAYLCEEAGNSVAWMAKIKEVRLIVITDITYGLLEQKIRSLFPDLSNRGFAITWQDEDSDMITVSCQEELQQALTFATNGAFKVYIKMTGAEITKVPVVESIPVKVVPQTENSTTEIPTELPKQEVHPNIVCDGCNSNVVGPRFKCLSCDDYDLCQTCLNKNVHYDHDMIRIVAPTRISATRHWFRPMQHIWQKLARHSLHFEKKEEKIKCKLESIREKHMRRRQHYRQMPKDSAEQTDKTSENTGFNQEIPAFCDMEFGHRFFENLPKHHLLKTIGTSVANMLDPLGINVTIDVENSDGEIESCASCTSKKEEKKTNIPKETEQTTATSETETPKQATTTSGTPCAPTNVFCQDSGLFSKQEAPQMTEEPLTIGKIVSSIHEMSEDFQRRLQTMEPEERRNAILFDRIKEVRHKLVEALLDVHNANETQPKAVVQDKVDAENEQPKLTKENVEASCSNPIPLFETGAIPKRSSSSDSSVLVMSPPEEPMDIPEHGWTLINKDASPVKETVEAETPKTVTFEVPLTNPSASIYPSFTTEDEKLDMALIQMIHMGYSNEGEWLSSLLKAKNGDIAAVLDVLHPSRA